MIQKESAILKEYKQKEEEEMTELQVYLWLMLDNIKVTSTVMAAFIASFFSLTTIILYAGVHIEGKLEYKKPALIGTIISSVMILMLFCTCLIPTTKQYAAVKVLPKMVNSELVKDMQQDMPEMYQIAKEYLKEIVSKSDAE